MKSINIPFNLYLSQHGSYIPSTGIRIDIPDNCPATFKMTPDGSIIVELPMILENDNDSQSEIVTMTVEPAAIHA